MNLVEYWKKRCELAEAYIDEIPCDPDIYKEQLDAWNNWCEFKTLPIADVVGRSEQLCGLVGCNKTTINGTSACEDHQRFCE